MKLLFAITVILLANFVSVGCLQAPSDTSFNRISENDTFCGIKANMLTTEKLKAAGFQGTAEFKPSTPKPCVTSHCSYIEGEQYFLPEKGIYVSVNGAGVGHCDLSYEHVSQDDKAYFVVSITEIPNDSAMYNGGKDILKYVCENSTWGTEALVVTNEFGERSCEASDYALVSETLIFAKGNKIIRIDGKTEYPMPGTHEPYPMENRELVKSNAKVIAKLIEDAI